MRRHGIERTAASAAAATPHDPTALFCDRSRSRIDTAVSQGLSILAGLALGGTVGGGPGGPGRGEL